MLPGCLFVKVFAPISDKNRMAILDLQPLSEVTIEELKLGPADLWMIKIGAEVYGPFETHSLKQYAAENASHFSNALTAHPASDDWSDFHLHPELTTAKVIEPSAPKEQRCWTMKNGKLSSPLSAEEICSQVNIGELILIDHVSCDEGHSWQKINKLPEFAHLAHTQQELPKLPSEESFQRARQDLLQLFNLRSLEPAEDEKFARPSVVFSQSQISKAHLDDYSLPQQRHTKSVDVASGTRRAMPIAACVVVILMAVGYFTQSSDQAPSEPLQAESTPAEVIMPERSIAQRSPPPTMPNSYREPSSYQPTRPDVSYREAAYTQPDYPTVIETHDHNEVMDNQDQFLDPVAESPAPVEHSLVAPQATAEETLDAAMSHAVIPIPEPSDSPIVEASDL